MTNDNVPAIAGQMMRQTDRKTMSNEAILRREIIDTCVEMSRRGLTYNTAGNVSARLGDVMLITPTSTPYHAITPDMIAALPLDSSEGRWSGPLKPSVEWRFHRDILNARPEVNGIVHGHAPFSTILAVARKPIPAVHYMIAAFGGDDIRCSGFAMYGTAALSRLAVVALEGRKGCLLANHGMIAIGSNLERALWLASELEMLASQYYHALAIGGPVLLTEAEVIEARKSFGTYGQPGEARY